MFVGLGNNLPEPVDDDAPSDDADDDGADGGDAMDGGHAPAAAAGVRCAVAAGHSRQSARPADLGSPSTEWAAGNRRLATDDGRVATAERGRVARTAHNH